MVYSPLPCGLSKPLVFSNLVYLYKRAQILIADLWACFEGKSLGFFHDIETITMFADYRVPQALNYLGLIKYSADLIEFLRKDGHLASGDRREVEIRAVSIASIELVRQEMQRQVPNNAAMHVNSILIDFFIWDFAKKHEDVLKSIPIHKTRGIYY
jgi:hypothetical protein